MTQQCQPGASVTGQSAAGEGATVDAAKNGPAVMAVAGGQKQRSRRQPSSRPLVGQRENPLTRREDDAPCSVPRTARARAMAAPRTTHPVALTLRRDRRRLWQEKRTTLRLRHNDRVKKGAPRHLDFVFFPFSSFSLLQQGPGKGDTPKGILLREGNGPRAPLLIRGSKAGPSEGFNSRLRALGLHAHYWSEV
jgi:hypothetical protein